MNWYIVLLACLGLLILAVAWLPTLLHRLPLSLPIICVAFGFGLFSIPGTGPAPNAIDHPYLTQHLTELIVIVALMGAGLKLNRPLGWRSWIVTWRLLAITMPLSIAGIALLGWAGLGLAPAAALLLGAVLAPTDPVLASDVQVGPPHEPEEDDVRFSLTSEAGLNDGLAFPFVYLAIALAGLGLADPSWLGSWLLRDGLYRIAAGAAVGVGIGWLLARLIYNAPHDKPVASTGLASVALCVFLIAYGAAELAGGYGFVAAFVSAVVLRGAAHDHDYNGILFDFVEEVEHAAMVLILFLLGGVALLVLPHLTPPTASAASARSTIWPTGWVAPASLITRSFGRSWWRRSCCPRSCTA
jgi:NhaP-type Na+/H+ or K+/H+ antiporter